MKVITSIERKYYMLDHDRALIKGVLNGKMNKEWLQNQMGYKNYVTLWRKLNCVKGSHFDEMEVQKLEQLLNVKFEID